LHGDALSALKQGETLFTQTVLQGTPVALYAERILDYSGNPIGVLVVAKDRTEHVASFQGLTRMVVVLGVIAAAVIALCVAGRTGCGQAHSAGGRCDGGDRFG